MKNAHRHTYVPISYLSDSMCFALSAFTHATIRP